MSEQEYDDYQNQIDEADERLQAEDDYDVE